MPQLYCTSHNKYFWSRHFRSARSQRYDIQALEASRPSMFQSLILQGIGCSPQGKTNLSFPTVFYISVNRTETVTTTVLITSPTWGSALILMSFPITSRPVQIRSTFAAHM